MLCSIYRHIILGATIGVVKAMVFKLPIYRINHYINSGLKRGATKAVVYRQCYNLSQKHNIADYLILGD